MDLAGLYEIKHRPGKDLKTYIASNNIKLICKSLPVTFRFFITVLMEIKAGVKTASDFMMPNHENNNNNLIPVEDAVFYAQNVLKSEGYEEEKIKEICDEIYVLSERDLFSRILRNKNTNQLESNKNKYISFDAFVGYLLEVFVSSIMKRLQLLHSNLIMNCKSPYECRSTFENFTYSVSLKKIKFQVKIKFKRGSSSFSFLL